MSLELHYTVEPGLSPDEFIALLRRTSLGARRPVDDVPRVTAMLAGADVIVTARLGGRLVGVARALTDFVYCTYLSDLAVDEAHQRQGIGQELLRHAHQVAGLHTILILIAAPAARSYYPHIGLTYHDSCWFIPAQAPPPARE